MPSLDYVRHYMIKYRGQKRKKSIQWFSVANKSKSTFIDPIGQRLSREWDIPFITTSAKYNENVEKAFELLLGKILDFYKSN